MEFSARHHETLVQWGIDRNEVTSQAPLLADTMRKIVGAILKWEPHVMLSSYNKKKGKVSKKEKEFPVPDIANLPHKERKHLSKAAFHDALEFRAVDLKRDRITGACREIQAEYMWGVDFPEKKLWKDARMLMWAYFLFRKTDGAIGLVSTFDTVMKNPSTGAFESSNILATLKSVLQSAEKNKEIDYKAFMKKLSKYTEHLLETYREPKAKK
jgi:hypothetical protein